MLRATDIISKVFGGGQPTSRGRRARLRRVTFDVFAQLWRQHTMSVLLNL